ncbi:hypothetical protein QBC36DRAFT_21790 [Triangularia setosa]|uniref:Uncharacterized protein n=1 Tax=Triangularia setosa TaxID=2587417 RepID=A0AAN6W5N6_9PEZI|nr:hypothetical protein QBC36DRAFT_21790 [Podospora setosa]
MHLGFNFGSLRFVVFFSPDSSAFCCSFFDNHFPQQSNSNITHFTDMANGALNQKRASLGRKYPFFFSTGGEVRVHSLFIIAKPNLEKISFSGKPLYLLFFRSH